MDHLFHYRPRLPAGPVAVLCPLSTRYQQEEHCRNNCNGDPEQAPEYGGKVGKFCQHPSIREEVGTIQYVTLDIEYGIEAACQTNYLQDEFIALLGQILSSSDHSHPRKEAEKNPKADNRPDE